MRIRFVLALLLCIVGCNGCARQKSTTELLEDLKGKQEGPRTSAVRQLPHHKQDAAEVVPALIAALKDRDSDVRRSAALALGEFGEQARAAIPALQAVQRDRDARVREAARIAIARIDPSQANVPAK